MKKKKNKYRNDQRIGIIANNKITNVKLLVTGLSVLQA